MPLRRWLMRVVGLVLALLPVTACSLLPIAPQTPAGSTVTPLGAPTPSLAASPADCAYYPEWGFADVWRDEGIRTRLGCAVAPADGIEGTWAQVGGIYSFWLRSKCLFVALFDAERRWVFVTDESGLPSTAPLMTWPIPECPTDTPGTPPSPAPTPTPLEPSPPTSTSVPAVTPASATRASTPSPCPNRTLTPAATPPLPAREDWPRGLFPATGRHAWLARMLGRDENGVVWAQWAEVDLQGVWQPFAGGWLFWNGQLCWVLFADGTFRLC